MDSSTAAGDRIFQHAFSCGADRAGLTLKAPINIEELKKKDVPELCARLLNYHSLPCFVETGILPVVLTVIAVCSLVLFKAGSAARANFLW